LNRWMGTQIDVCLLVGSLRKGSLSRMLADALILLAPASMELAIVEIGHLPFYNQDIEDHPPVEWTTFRERVKATNAVLFVTPEYNRSVPAVLKNALDVGSRPYRKQRLGPQARRSRERFAGRNWWLRCESPFAAVACFSERADHAAARSLYRACRRALR
jgi:NAD(P)H-dependent FMN reductase